MSHVIVSTVLEYPSKIDDLLGEIDRLREALEHIRFLTSDCDPGTTEEAIYNTTLEALK